MPRTKPAPRKTKAQKKEVEDVEEEVEQEVAPPKRRVRKAVAAPVKDEVLDVEDDMDETAVSEAKSRKTAKEAAAKKKTPAKDREFELDLEESEVPEELLEKVDGVEVTTKTPLQAGTKLFKLFSDDMDDSLWEDDSYKVLLVVNEVTEGVDKPPFRYYGRVVTETKNVLDRKVLDKNGKPSVTGTKEVKKVKVTSAKVRTTKKSSSSDEE